MRQPGAVIEGRPALVVDEDKANLIRMVGQREGSDEGTQQLRLARPGGAGDQGVRTIATEVELEAAGLVHPDRHSHHGSGLFAPAPGQLVGEPARPQRTGRNHLSANHSGQPGGPLRDESIPHRG